MTPYSELLDQVSTLAATGEAFLAEVRQGRLRAPFQFSANFHCWVEAASFFLDEVSPELKRNFLWHHTHGSGVSSPEATVLLDLDDATKRTSFQMRLSAQLGILKSVPDILDIRARSLRGLLAADLFADELDACRELVANGYSRAAGAVGAVVLERHLKLMCERRGISLGPREMIGSINSKLRDRYGNPSDFSRVQWLANLRAEFDHDKGVEPSADKAREFIDSIATFVSTTN